MKRFVDTRDELRENMTSDHGRWALTALARHLGFDQPLTDQDVERIVSFTWDELSRNTSPVRDVSPAHPDASA